MVQRRDVRRLPAPALPGQTGTQCRKAIAWSTSASRPSRKAVDRIAKLRQMPLRVADGTVICLDQVADITDNRREMELHRDDLRQDDRSHRRPRRPRHSAAP